MQDIRPSKASAVVRVELYPEVPKAAYTGSLKTFVNPYLASKKWCAQFLWADYVKCLCFVGFNIERSCERVAIIGLTLWHWLTKAHEVLHTEQTITATHWVVLYNMWQTNLQRELQVFGWLYWLNRFASSMYRRTTGRPHWWKDTLTKSIRSIAILSIAFIQVYSHRCKFRKLHSTTSHQGHSQCHSSILY